MARRRNRFSHVKEIYYIGAILALVALTLVTVWGPGGYLDLRRAQAALETHRTRVGGLKQSNQQRLERIQLLRSNPHALEGYARQKGYGRKGEIIQQLPEEASPPPITGSKPPSP
jgi:cell division protein FtsB